MPQDFEIKWKISEESVPGGLKVDACPKSYYRYRDLFEAAREVRKIDDFRELRIPYYPSFSPFEYQREAVLRMLGRFRGKGIFGDQVGLGKTIEVGMTVAEYAVRGAIRNVLLLCPRKLDFQWAQEVKDKFSAHFTGCVVQSFAQIAENERKKANGVTMYIMTFDVALAEVKALKQKLERDIEQAEEWLAAEKFKPHPGENYRDMVRATDANKALYARLSKEIDENYLKLLDAYARSLPEINMVVVDEADALLSVDPGKTLQIYRVVERLCALPTVVYKILMSATPIRRQLADIYKLMKIVRPEQFRDMDDFIRNYCFGKARLSDFRGEELRQLKGLIDQLFTRSRLTSKTVRRSLEPLTIREVTYLNFNNFASPAFEAQVREAVTDGLCLGESATDTKYLRQNLADFDAAAFGSDMHWAQYVRQRFFESDDPPFVVTEEKDRAFAASLSARIADFTGAEADAVRFACENYVVPPKRGHRIRYKGEISREAYAKLSAKERQRAEDEAYDDAVSARYMRKARIEGGYASEREGTLAYYDASEIDSESKYAEFDRLVNELLPEEKVLVFSDAGAERNTLIRLVDSVHKGRALNGEGDTDNKNYLRFRSDEPKYRKAVYFAISGEEKGFNMQFCSNLIITNLPHDPNLVEQIVGRISRIGQRGDMHVYVFVAENSLEYYLYSFYNDELHLFSDWDGDNTFIIGGAVAAFLENNRDVHRELLRRVGKTHRAGDEPTEVGFSQIVEYLWEQYQSGYGTGTFDDFAPWAEFRRNVRESIESFRALVGEFGDQELYTDEDLM